MLQHSEMNRDLFPCDNWEMTIINKWMNEHTKKKKKNNSKQSESRELLKASVFTKQKKATI